MRTVASGVCHSDLHYVDGVSNTVAPAILGHEAAGIVEEVGEQVTYLQPGDHVISCLSVFCGACHQCLSGHPSRCTQRPRRSESDPPRLSFAGSGAPITQVFNLSSYAERMLVHENALVKIDDDMPFDCAALIGCGVVTGVGAVINTARIEPGCTVAVFGLGGVGLSAVQGARIAGARQIIAVDVVEPKLTHALDLGATHVVDASSQDPVEAIQNLTDGGVDYSFRSHRPQNSRRAGLLLPDTWRHRNCHRHNTPRPEGRDRGADVPQRAKDTGQRHGLEPVSHRHAASHRVLPPGPSAAGRDDHPPGPP